MGVPEPTAIDADEDNKTAAPPVYSPSDTSPNYAAELSHGEHRLTHAGAGSSRSRPPAAPPQGSFTHQAGNIVVTLFEQEPDTAFPVYRQDAIISGEVYVHEEDVLSVTLQLEGYQSIYMEDGGRARKEYFNHSHDLWKQQQGGTKVPAVLPFQLPFPTQYTNERGTFSLPPSHSVWIPFSNVSAGNVYMLRVTLTKKRFVLWEKQKMVDVKLRYRPFLCPPAPLPAGPPSLSVLESSPADWHQVHSTINSRDPTWDMVHCILYIPSVQVFAFTDTIPFHLQLKGPMKSLLKLLGISTIAGITGAEGLPAPTSGSPSTSQKVASAIRNASSLVPQRSKDKNKESDDETQLSVKVIMRRHITVALMGQVVAKTLVLGEAKLSAPSQSSADPQAAAFDWEGSLCVGPDKTVAGSFAVGGVQVKDSFLVQIRPDNNEKSPFPEHQHSHQIQLVPNSYEDSVIHPADT